ncbi:hypothetical protein EV174_000299 [Coemansia sp. RSA 2320]|nr:hypothetical protein EV174_000299 [Coemansia sp. RSA 2320]
MLNELYLTAATSGNHSSARLSADPDTDYLTFDTLPTHGYINNNNYNSTNSNYSNNNFTNTKNFNNSSNSFTSSFTSHPTTALGSTTIMCHQHATDFGSDYSQGSGIEDGSKMSVSTGDTLFDSFVATEYYSPDRQLQMEAAPGVQPLRHSGAQRELGMFAAPLLTDMHSLDMFAESLSSASVPATPMAPHVFGGAATAPLGSALYCEPAYMHNDEAMPYVEALRSAYESYLSTPANPAYFASPNVAVAQRALSGEQLLFAPLEEIRGKDEDLLSQLAYVDPVLRQNLVHALVNNINPTVAYQPVTSLSSALDMAPLIAQAQSLAAASVVLPEGAGASAGTTSLFDSLLGVLSPSAGSDSVAPMELLGGGASPLVLAPEAVFRTPRLPSTDEEEDDDDQPLALVTKRKQRSCEADEAAEGEDECGKRPRFHCEICNRGFSRQYNMRTHRLTHDPQSNAARPFNCEHCRRTFTRKHDLIRHQILHDDSAPFKCGVCSRGFAREDVLERHVRAVHKD